MKCSASAAILVAFGMMVETAGCGGSGSSGAPTAPTTPARAMLVFTPTGTAGPNSYALVDRGEQVPGQIAINVTANNFTRAVSMFRGTIVYDPAVLQVADYTQGDFMAQGNALATFSVTQGGQNSVVIRVDKPTSVLGSTGSGTVLTLRFAPATGVRSGSSPLQWTDTHAFQFDFTDVLFDVHGGTITVR